MSMPEPSIQLLTHTEHVPSCESHLEGVTLDGVDIGLDRLAGGDA
jgi:hypothetical protein